MNWKKLFWRKSTLIQDLEYYKRINKELEDTAKELQADNISKHKELERLQEYIKSLKNEKEELDDYNTECLEKIDKCNEEIEKLNEQYKHLLDGATEYCKEVEKYKDIAAKEIENSKSSVETSKALAGVVALQQSSISALAEGIYNQEHIEFFALKTYRGWKYICVNGQKITDFNNVNTINISWNKNDTRLKVDIK